MSEVKSALRTLLVIELLTEHDDGLTFPEIVAALKLPKSSAHALLQTLLDRGHLAFDDGTKHYRVGLRLWEAGRAHERGFDLPAIARPFLEAARDELGETVQLAVLDGIENVYIAKVESEQRLVLASRVGMRLPAYATGLGKVLLAGLTDDEVRARFDGATFARFTTSTIVDLDDLLETVRQARSQGHAVDMGEYTAGVRCVAVPVRDRYGGTVAAMSVSVPDIRIGSGSLEHIREVLVRHASACAEQLGGRRAPIHRSSA